MKFKVTKFTVLILAVASLIITYKQLQAEEFINNGLRTNWQATGDSIIIDNSQIINPEGQLLLNFSAKPNVLHPISQEQLKNAESLQDLMRAYPTAYIDEYREVRLANNTKVCRSKSDRLNKDQKLLIQALRASDKFSLEVDFFSKGILSKELEAKKMNFEITVIPASEARYPGGEKAMNTFLRQQCLKMQEKFHLVELTGIQMAFTVNEKGEVEKPHLEECSSKEEQTNFLKNALLQMPQWAPALDEFGKAMGQEFYLEINGFDGC